MKAAQPKCFSKTEMQIFYKQNKMNKMTRNSR